MHCLGLVNNISHHHVILYFVLIDVATVDDSLPFVSNILLAQTFGLIGMLFEFARVLSFIERLNVCIYLHILHYSVRNAYPCVLCTAVDIGGYNPSCPDL